GVAAALLVGVSMATWNGAPLPIDLSPWGGGSGCLIGSSGEAMAFATTSSSGAASLRFTVPSQPALVGRVLFHTWLIADPAAPNNRLGLVTTASAASRIGY
ncbi:MAG: hypothetical protein KDC87_11155, partial [Planctomycetes bacterium]|nr:hypothetical protein [Planctomycetota bacterium]